MLAPFGNLFKYPDLGRNIRYFTVKSRLSQLQNQKNHQYILLWCLTQSSIHLSFIKGVKLDVATCVLTLQYLPI